MAHKTLQEKKSFTFIEYTGWQDYTKPNISVYFVW